MNVGHNFIITKIIQISKEESLRCLYRIHYSYSEEKEVRTKKGLEAKGPFSCLGLQVQKVQKDLSDTNKLLIPLGCEILFKYYLYSSSNYFKIIFESYIVLMTKLLAKN